MWLSVCLATEYMCHVYVRSGGLASVLVSDQEYPQRVAFSLLNKVFKNIFSYCLLFWRLIWHCWFGNRNPGIQLQPVKSSRYPKGFFLNDPAKLRAVKQSKSTRRSSSGSGGGSCCFCYIIRMWEIECVGWYLFQSWCIIGLISSVRFCTFITFRIAINLHLVNRSFLSPEC